MENKKPLVSAQINTSGDDVTTWALPGRCDCAIGTGACARHWHFPRTGTTSLSERG